MKAYITSLDYFGTPLSINVKQSKESAHKTLYGGIASAIIKSTLIGILLFTLHQIFEQKLDRTSSNVKLKS